MGILDGFYAIGGALLSVGSALLTFVFALCGVVATLVSALPVIIVAVAITCVMVPWARYGDRAIESGVHAMTNTVYPLWRDSIRPLAVLARDTVNPLVCWFNALNWWGNGMVRYVLWPTARECGFRQLVLTMAAFIKAVGRDLLLYVASGRFMSQYADFSAISPAGAAMFQAWIDLYSCSCMDLGDVLRTIPLANPLILLPPLTPVMLPLAFFSQQWTDPNTWCAIANGFNAGIALVQQLLRLIIQVINFIIGNTRPGQVFERPDVRAAVDKLCPAISCFARSTEAAVQVFWNRYVPFHFDFTDFLCLADALACIALKAVAGLGRIIINIDAAVTYPANPFWESVVKPDVIEWINLWSAPSAFAPVRVPNAPAPARFYITSYRLETTEQTTPLMLPNPLYGKRRVDECLCIFITRFICDPTNMDTACYSHDAQNLLMGFDFCCTSYAVGTTLADIASALFEATMHFAKGPDDFFLTIDAQPYTTVLRTDIVRVARCLLAIFGLIPYVGTFIRDLLAGLIQFVSGMIDLSGRVILGLGTLPYFLIAMPGTSNYLMVANRGLDYFVQIHAELIEDTPRSVKNSLCGLLNNGFPVPPIPCSSCFVGGFLPSTGKRTVEPPRRFFDPHTGKDVNGPLALMRQAWGIAESDIPTNDAASHITPLLRYENHTTNPVELYNLFYVGIQTFDPHVVLAFPNMRSVDEFVDQKKRDLLQRWAGVKQCNRVEDEARRQLRENPRMYEYREQRGDFKCPTFPGGESGGTSYIEPYRAPSTNLSTNTDIQERSTLGPLEPTIVGCNPKPQCFDLCCGPRAILVFVVHLAQMLARFINGLAQGGAGLQGTTQDFPYFTGEFANYGKPTFESDFITGILLLFKLPKCLCQVLNLIIPVIPTNTTQGRPDVCCFIQRIGELVACIFQVIINAINALALGSSTHFVYFRNGFFRNDVNALFDLTLAVIECLCIFVRATFPFNYISAIKDATDFDICCGPSALLNTLTEVARLLLQIIISIATITSDDTHGISNSFCYWRLDQTSDPKRHCGGTLDEIGVVKQIDHILDTFFPLHSGDPNNPVSSPQGDCAQVCNMDNGQSGIVPCLCQIFDTLIPFRRFPNKPVSCSADPAKTNCQQLDLCCPAAKIGFFLSDLTKFVVRGVVAAWQPWSGGLPEFLVHYIFCSEFLAPACPGMQIKYPNPCDDIVNVMIPSCDGVRPVLNASMVVNYRCGEYTCGKFNIVIADLVHPFDGLISKCTCELVGLLDLLIAFLNKLMSNYIPQAGWACCFCGGQTEDGLCNVRFVSACNPGQNFKPTSDPQGGSGILPALSFIVQAVLVSLTDLQRKFALPCYWHPVPVGHIIPTQLRETWIFNFLAPTADALAVASGNLMCIATSTFFLPPITIKPGERFLGSIVRWVADIIIRVVAFIEAFVSTLIASNNQCVGSKDACEGRQGAGHSTKGVNSRDLGKMLVILLSIPIDILIGDSHVACTTVCPPINANPAPYPCECWNLAPLYGAGDTEPLYEWVADADATGHGVCRDMTQSLLDAFIYQHVGTPFGTNTSGYPYPTRYPNGTIILPFVALPAGCCRLRIPSKATPNGLILPALPICQSPDDSRDFSLFPPYAGDPGYPGSCVVKSACRGDALPSIANDALIPLGLAINYVSAIDGILMGFTRYLRALLDHLFTCPKVGMSCNPQAQFGIIFYPLIIIMSISWQILGGVVRFGAAVGIFFFSLFTPPSGSTCGCWQHDEMDPYNLTKTQYYRQTVGLCYPCRTLDHDCGTSVDVPELNILSDPLFVQQYRCNEYCPARQILRNPALTHEAAVTKCIADYTVYAKKKLPIGYTVLGDTPGAVNPKFTYDDICRGHQRFNYTLTEALPEGFNLTANPGRPHTYVWPPCNFSGAGQVCISFAGIVGCSHDDTHCLCNPANSNSNNVGDSGKFIILDFCPDPTCQNIGPGYDVQVGGHTVSAFWPCGGGGGGVFDTQYPAGSQVTCGALQIISSALDVFHAFVEIFTTPIFVPPNKKRDESDADSNVWERALKSTLRQGPPIGPRRREPRQVFNARIKKRFDGTTYGAEMPGPNAAEVLVAAVYDYDTSDCYTDPVTCHCRNLDLAGHCQVDQWGNVVYGAKRRRTVRHLNGTVTTRDEPMAAADITAVMSQEMFVGTTVCDHTADAIAGLDWDTHPNVTITVKNQYVKCLDKMIQGSRMNTVNEVFPPDIMYNSQAPIQVVQNVFHGFKEQVRKRYDQIRASHAEPRTRNTHSGRYETIREEQERLFPSWGTELHEREQFARNVLIQEYRIPPTHIMFDAIIKFDRIYYKYYRGFYGWSLRKLSHVLATGQTAFPTTTDALREVSASVADLRRVIWNQPYRYLVDSAFVAGEHVQRGMGIVMEEGPIQFIKRGYNVLYEQRRAKRDSNTEQRLKEFEDALRESPLYKMWNGDNSSSTPTRSMRDAFWSIPFVAHMRHFIQFQRQHWQTEPLSAWTADLHYYSLVDVLKARFGRVMWTPEKLRNWDRLKSFAYRMQEHIWPGSVSEEHRQRFLLDGNCILIDRTVNLTMQVVDYCANEFVANVRSATDKRYIDGTTYWDETSFYRDGTYHGWRTRNKWRHEADASSGWLRPRWILPNDTEPPLAHRVGYREYRHAMHRTVNNPMEVHGPGGWNLYDWLVKVVEDLTGYALGARTDGWFAQLQAWILNPNTSINQWPDVGLAYWIRFPFTCNFPQSLNCSIGIGFEQALLWVTIGFAGVIVAGIFVLPGITIPLQVIGYPIAYFFVLMAVAFHMPPACMLLFPSFPLPFGITVPECAIDQIVAFADKWIVPCYVPLVIPSYMVSGDPCPTDPSRYIDVINFRDIGVSDGVQHILFLGVRLLGHVFSDLVLFASSLVPGVYPYMAATLADFNAAMGTQLQRQWAAFVLTFPAVFTPALVIYVAFIVLSAVVPAVLRLVEALVSALFALPGAAGGAMPLAPVTPGGGGGFVNAAIDAQLLPPSHKRTLMEKILFGSGPQRAMLRRRIVDKKNQ